MDNNWQVQQWFDVEQAANQALLSKCRSLVDAGQQFDIETVQQLFVVTECPVVNVNVAELVDQFNELLHTLH